MIGEGDGPEIVRGFSLRQYLVLYPAPGEETDQEELEWPLLQVAGEIARLLNNRGLDWSIPLFERECVLFAGRVQLSSLLLQVPAEADWNIYEKAVKASLQQSRDPWVVLVRMERRVSENVVRCFHQGEAEMIPEKIGRMKGVAREKGFVPDNVRWRERFFSDPEETDPELLIRELSITIR